MVDKMNEQTKELIIMSVIVILGLGLLIYMSYQFGYNSAGKHCLELCKKFVEFRLIK